MRTLVIEAGPAYSVADVQRGILAGLRHNGVEAHMFNLSDRLSFYCNVKMKRKGRYIDALEYEAACAMASEGILSACWKYGPDVVVIVSSFFLPPTIYQALRARGVHVVLWLTESPYEDERQIPMAGYANTVITNDPTNLDDFRQQNPRTFYIPHGYHPEIHHNRNRTGEHAFSFVGTGFPSRIEFFEKVDWPCVPVFAGNWQQLTDDSPLLPFLLHDPAMCIENDDAADLYRSSITSANLYRKEAMTDDHVEGWAIGPREVELAACATFFAREARAEGDELFPMLPTFTEPGEISDIIRWALDHPDERFAAAQQARAAVADRTFQDNAALLLRHIDV